MYFVGLDLAWSYNNTSAMAVLEGRAAWACVTAWDDALKDDDEIIRFLEDTIKSEPALIAIDAPLIVPNETGTRPCDRELSLAFRRHEAGTHPANRRKFGGLVRGEELVKRLSEAGFAHSPQIVAGKEVRQVIEVYPHPAAVTLFGLERTLKYKARPARSYGFRWAEFRRYQALLQGLANAQPAMVAPEILSREVEGLRGQALKRYEDLLDALFCAYIALYCWHWGPRRYRVFGDMESGYIVVPWREALE